MKKQAYLINKSMSVTSIPLFHKVPVTVNGRVIQETKFKSLVPGEIFPLGLDASYEEKKFYKQLDSIGIKLRFRDVEEPEAEKESNSEENSAEASQSEVPESIESSDVEVKHYEEAEMKKMRQAELIAIAKEMGIEADTNNSKAEIISKILEKSVG